MLNVHSNDDAEHLSSFTYVFDLLVTLIDDCYDSMWAFAFKQGTDQIRVLVPGLGGRHRH